MPKEMLSVFPEILEGLAAKLTALLIENQMDQTRARDIAFSHAEQVRRDWGGRRYMLRLGCQAKGSIFLAATVGVMGHGA